MKANFVLWAAALLCAAAVVSAQNQRVWIVFDAREIPALTGDVHADAARLGITERALQRRAKVLPYNRLIDERDYPVSAARIERLKASGAVVRSVSRWFNAVSVDASPEQAAAFRTMPGVAAVMPVVIMKSSVLPAREFPGGLDKAGLGKMMLNDSSSYGPSLTQVRNIRINAVHQLGINGSGVLIGMNDDGYSAYTTHEAMKPIKVIAEYDFVQRDGDTQVAPGERSNQGTHGAYTLSSMAGFMPGKLIGPAYGASFALAKTEVDSVEIQKEEDLYVEGLEWHERLGVDIVSTSLGYNDWYTYAQLNGRTAITTNAARVLAQKGVLLVTAMGNEGQIQPGKTTTTGTLVAPADADSIVSVGATFSDGELASFSSTGPASDGRIKPEVVAQGVSVYCASPYSSSAYAGVSGTSLSTPLTAGVAALILSAHPELTPMQVREALIKTAVPITGFPNTSSYPNNYYGNGWVDALNAVLYHGPVISNRMIVTDLGTSLKISVWIKSNASLTISSLVLKYRKDSTQAFSETLLAAVGNDSYTATISKASLGTTPQGYIMVSDQSGKTAVCPAGAPASLQTLVPTPYDQLAYYPDVRDKSIPEGFTLMQNAPNPFPTPGNPGTRVQFTLSSPQHVVLEVFNLLGQRVRLLFDGIGNYGVNSFIWDGRDDNSRVLSSGVYLLRMNTGNGMKARKMLLVR